MSKSKNTDVAQETAPATPPVDVKDPRPTSMMNLQPEAPEYPTREELSLAFELAKEKVAELEEEQRSLSLESQKAAEAKDFERFWEVQRRAGEIRGELYLARRAVLEARIALAEGMIRDAENGLPELLEEFEERRKVVQEAQARLMVIGKEITLRKKQIQQAKSWKPDIERQIEILDVQYASLLQEQARSVAKKQGLNTLQPRP